MCATPTHDSERAATERAASPGFSWCFRCGRPWNHVVGHSTRYTEHSGCFPLCESCWTRLGHPEARIPYYRTLIEEWDRSGCTLPDEERRAIGRAVTEGR
jgi:hypothetical protein